MAALSHRNMGTKLWTVLVVVTAMTSATTLDLSNLMGLGFGKKEETPPKPIEVHDNYQSSGHLQHQKDKLGHFQGVDPHKINKFEPVKLDHNKDMTKIVDKGNVHHNNNFNNFSSYSPIGNAHPVEIPTYANYEHMSPPVIDDGSYSSNSYSRNRPNYGQQYNRGQYRGYGPNRGPARRPYNSNYGQPNYGQRPPAPIYGPPPQRPHGSHYGSPPQYGNAQIYGGSNSYGGNSGSYGPPIVVPQDAGYHQEARPYSGPSLDSYHGQQSYGQSIDYSKYVSPISYSEVSEYMSPAQYNDYTGMLYSAYNLSPPGGQQHSYNSNYSSYKSNYNNNYNKDFKMIVAVVVITADINDYHFKSKDSSKTHEFNDKTKAGLDQGGFKGPFTTNFNHNFNKDFNKEGLKNQETITIQGTLFISEIYPYVNLVSGVITGMPPNHNFGIAIHTYGDITNGCQSIGDHYNPTNRQHGNINAPQSHVGDLGNLKSDLAGVAFVNKISRNQFSIQGRNPVAGRSIGICSNNDDLGLGGSIASLKNGSCDQVIACGIIGLANTQMPASNSGDHH